MDGVISAERAIDYSDLYDPDLDFDLWYTILTARRLCAHLGPQDDILEVGSATGALTERLCQRVRRIVCVERSARYLARARARRPANAEIVDTAIEDFECDDRFDHVLAINMLHEVPDVAGVVAHLKRFLKPGGRLHVTLPNPRSLHRLAALHAGMIGDLCEISARGRSFQTLRLLYADEVAGLMKESGLAEVARSSILVKPLPNAAMETLSESVIEAFDALTAELPDFGSMNYFIFRRTGDE